MKLHQTCNPIALILVLYAVCSCEANLISNSNSLPDRYNYHSWNTYSALGCLQQSLCAGTHLLYYTTCPPPPSNSLHFCNTHKNLWFAFAFQGCIHQNEGKISSQMLKIYKLKCLLYAAVTSQSSGREGCRPKRKHRI